MLYIALVFLIVVAAKLLLNFSRFRRCKYLLKRYNEYLKQPNLEFYEHQIEIVNLFQQAGIHDSSVIHVEPVGFGQIATSRPSVFRNVGALREDIVKLMLSKFYGSVGVYKTRTLEALNPLHWVETLIFLPREILNYLGVSQANVVSKLLQLIYWFVTAAAFFVWGLYQTQVGLIVKNWIDKLLTP